MPAEIVHFKGNYLRLTTEEREGGVYERAYCRNGVSVIAVPKPGVVRVIQERDWHTGLMHSKLVSAYREDDEEAFACAKRELGEEMGFTAANWEHYFTGFWTGAVIKTQDFFIASDLTPCETKFDVGEEIAGHYDMTHAEIREAVLALQFGANEQAFALLKYATERS